MLEIRDNFYLNGEPFKIISGAFHYFRTVPEYWQDRIEKLVNLGCNTVETYIPWNFHEPEKGNFRFDGMHDIERFMMISGTNVSILRLLMQMTICWTSTLSGLL